MKVIRPTTATQTSDPEKHGYNAYDFSGKGEQEITAKYNGKVIKYSDGETRNWLAFTSNDPYKDTRKGKLLTQDYGNYILVEYEGGLRHLIAHFSPNTVRKMAFSKGDVLGVVGNTGNSTGKHSHHEYRQGSTNIKVEFIDDVIISPPNTMDYKAIFDKTGNIKGLEDRSPKPDFYAPEDEFKKAYVDPTNGNSYVVVNLKALNDTLSYLRELATPPTTINPTYTTTTNPPVGLQGGDNFTVVDSPPLPVEPDLPANPAVEVDIFDWLWRKISNLWKH